MVQLHLGEPSALKEALQLFTVLENPVYANKHLGNSGQLEVMTCECGIHHGRSGTRKSRSKRGAASNTASNTANGTANGVAESDDESDELPCGPNSNCINRMCYMECYDDHCCVGDCGNRRFQLHQFAKVDVFHAGKKGFGVRALEDIPEGGFIYEYTGEVLDEARFVRRQQKYEREGVKHFYFMMLQKDEFIDATEKGSIARFCNHSCNPNAQIEKWVVGPKLRMGLFAKRDIQRGEEICFDYKVDRYGSKAQPCYCGEPNCSGFLGGRTQTGGTLLPPSVVEGLGLDSEIALDWPENALLKLKLHASAHGLDLESVLLRRNAAGKQPSRAPLQSNDLLPKQEPKEELPHENLKEETAQLSGANARASSTAKPAPAPLKSELDEPKRLAAPTLKQELHEPEHENSRARRSQSQSLSQNLHLNGDESPSQLHRLKQEEDAALERDSKSPRPFSDHKVKSEEEENGAPRPNSLSSPAESSPSQSRRLSHNPSHNPSHQSSNDSSHQVLSDPSEQLLSGEAALKSSPSLHQQLSHQSKSGNHETPTSSCSPKNDSLKSQQQSQQQNLQQNLPQSPRQSPQQSQWQNQENEAGEPSLNNQLDEADRLAPKSPSSRQSSPTKSSTGPDEDALLGTSKKQKRPKSRNQAADLIALLDAPPSSLDDSSRNVQQLLLDLLPSTPLTTEHLPEFMRILMQTQQRAWFIARMLRRVVDAEHPVQIAILGMHGYEIMASVLNRWQHEKDVTHMCLTVLQKWPKVTRNKISSSQIEGVVRTISTEGDKEVRKQAADLLEEWSGLSLGYRIPRRKVAEKDSSVEAPASEASSASASAPEASAPASPAKSQAVRTDHRTPRGPPLPPGWEARKKSNGQTYYFNVRTNTTSLTFPKDQRDIEREARMREKEQRAERERQLALQKEREQQALEIQRIIEEASNASSPSSLNTPAPEQSSSSKHEKSSKQPSKNSDRRSSSTGATAGSAHAPTLESVFAAYIPKLVFNFEEQLGRDRCKRHARDIVHVLAKKEQSKGTDASKLELTKDRKNKIKGFVKEYMAKVLARHGSEEPKHEGTPKKLKTAASGK